MRKILPAVIALGLAACGGSEPPKPPPGPGPASSPSTSPAADAPKNDPTVAPDPEIAITGRVRFEGAPPRVAKDDVTADPYCGNYYGGKKLERDTVLIGEDGAIRNVVVRVARGLEGRTFTVEAKTHELDQLGCRYEPHVLAMQRGQELVIKSSDDTIHNVNFAASINPAFNVGMKKGERKSVAVSQPEAPIRVSCNVHPWMSAYVVLVDHPYFALTGADGKFELKGLPPGSYVIEAWHESFGTKAATVKVGPKEKVTQDFAFTEAK